MGFTVYWSSQDSPIVNEDKLHTMASVLSGYEGQYGMNLKRTQTQLTISGSCETALFIADEIVKFRFCKTRFAAYTVPIVTSLMWLMMKRDNMSVTCDSDEVDLFEYFDRDLYVALNDGVADEQTIAQTLISRTPEEEQEDSMDAILAALIGNVRREDSCSATA